MAWTYNDLYGNSVKSGEIGVVSLEHYIQLQEQDLKAQQVFIELLKELERQQQDWSRPAQLVFYEFQTVRLNPVETLRRIMEDDEDYKYHAMKEGRTTIRVEPNPELMKKREEVETSIQGTIQQTVFDLRKQLHKTVIGKL